ncbi:hypothetical protein WME89_33595 [Sorangium sp. So ce321]|uniref:hypothetical protein n=1 Tax=Sorangium sp. So ce321 TaxID=3133300 RepID=UPI003F6293E5
MSRALARSARTFVLRADSRFHTDKAIIDLEPAKRTPWLSRQASHYTVDTSDCDVAEVVERTSAIVRGA